MSPLPFTSKGATFTCPRRFEMQALSRWPREVELSDVYTSGHGIIGQEKVGTSCTYCGSLNPNVLMAKLRDGWHLGGSDKSYKWYLHQPYTEAEIAAHRSKWEQGHVAQAVTAAAADEGTDLTAALDEAYAAHAQYSLRGATVAKFYTHHLNRAQCQEFLAMWGEGKLNHSLYVRPALPAMSEDAPAWLIGDPD